MIQLPVKRTVNREPSRFDKVGPKQKAEILKLLTSGMNVAQVAKHMRLTRETINYHKSPEAREKRLNIRRRWYYKRKNNIDH